MGLHCLRHIMQQSSRTELRWFGRSEVIYDSLLRALFGCDHVCLDAVILCLFDVLNVIEASPRCATGPRPWCRHDDVFAKYLTNMEMESKILLRYVYAKHLGSFVSRLGIVVVRHLSRLLHVVADYLQVTYMQTRFLKHLLSSITSTYARCGLLLQIHVASLCHTDEPCKCS